MEKYRRGDVREDGMVFFSYSHKAGVTSERWVTAEALAHYRAKRAEYNENWKTGNAERAALVLKEASKRYRAKNPDKIKDYACLNRDRIAEKARARRARQPERQLAYSRELFARKRAVYAAACRKWRAKKRECPLYKLACSMRSRVYEILKDGKTLRTLEYVGCDLGFLMNHLEAQFKPGMTWDNYGAWHVDHRTPLASAKTLGAPLPLFHYSNLQPLWAGENIAKGAKLV